MQLVLKRTYHPDGTNGELFINGTSFCFTIELPWKDNAKGSSCIPEGRYRLEKRFSEHHQHHLELKEVPGRSLILIHKANDAVRELRGCIAPVEHLTGHGKGYPSAPPFQKLLKLVSEYMDHEHPVYLEITKAS